MKHAADKPSPALVIAQRILAGILILVTLVILAGTIYALIVKPGKKPPEQNQDPQAVIQAGGRIFTGIGRIRASTAGAQPAAVIITIAFPYDPDDKSFSEELASKVARFRSETAQYFQGLTPDELRLKTDAELQRGLLARYNAQLRLGFIDTLYVTDYMIIE